MRLTDRRILIHFQGLPKFAVNLAAEDDEPFNQREIRAATTQQFRQQKALDAMEGERIEDVTGHMRFTHGFGVFPIEG